MKKNFYKEFQKKQKLSQNYNENDKQLSPAVKCQEENK